MDVLVLFINMNRGKQLNNVIKKRFLGLLSQGSVRHEVCGAASSQPQAPLGINWTYNMDVGVFFMLTGCDPSEALSF
jgi:hypothetical protein